MAPTIPPYLAPYLVSASFPEATDALEEWISHRRSKGDTLFEVSVGLAELEAKTPPHLGKAFDRARYLTNVPPPSDLTPPMGPFPLARSASPATIINHLLSQPPPSIEHSREVILEFVLARESKLKEKKPGRGGKGTLGREGFEEIGARLGEVESQLAKDEEDRALILSLRMSLSYFTLPGLAQQLLSSAVPVAERILIQHIRKRVQGEGRYGVGKELEYVEDLTAKRRALRPAFRSARARTSLPKYPNYPIALPAPPKAGCIRLLSTFIKDVETGGPSALASYTQPPPRTPVSPGLDRTSFNLRKQAVDKTPIATYALELVSEFLAREKREHMSKMKWAKSGRDQLSKELGDIESTFCTGKSATHAPTLLPIFLLLRRNYNLPESPLPSSVTEPYYDILPAPPEPDDVPFREPTVSTTTASLYVNPRLDDEAAAEVLEEFVESEKEKLQDDPDKDLILLEQIEAIEKRFPDGSYSSVFDQAKQLRSPQKTSHRRAVSTASRLPPVSPNLDRNSHNRSVSLPYRRDATDSSESESEPDEERPNLSIQTGTIVNAGLAPESALSNPTSAGGWWDVVSAVQESKPAPWQEPRSRTTSKVAELPLPPGAEPAQIPESPDFASLTLGSPPAPAPATPPRDSPLRSPPRRAVTMQTQTPERDRARAMTLQTPNRDLVPPPRLDRGVSEGSPTTTYTGSPSTPAKSKFGFGRSMTLGKKKEKDKTLNNPGKWNKDMVASIMGPPNK